MAGQAGSGMLGPLVRGVRDARECDEYDTEPLVEVQVRLRRAQCGAAHVRIMHRSREDHAQITHT
jgi:hypothetical protein